MISESRKRERNRTQLVLFLTGKTTFRQFCWFSCSGTRTDSAQLRTASSEAQCIEGRVTRLRIATAGAEDTVLGYKAEICESRCQRSASHPSRTVPSSENDFAMQRWEVSVNNTTRCTETPGPRRHPVSVAISWRHPPLTEHEATFL